MILGVDISTSITGFAIVADGELVYYDSIDLRKYKDIFDKNQAQTIDVYVQVNWEEEEQNKGKSWDY